MHEDKQRDAHPASGSAPGTDQRSSVSSRFEQFEKRQRELWRWTMLVLFLLAVAYAWTSKDAVHSFAHGLESLPIWLVILVVLFAAYVWNKTREISELRGLMHGLEQRDAEPPSDKQLDQLFEIISRSQQGYRYLIDSFHPVLLPVSLTTLFRSRRRRLSRHTLAAQHHV